MIFWYSTFFHLSYSIQQKRIIKKKYNIVRISKKKIVTTSRTIFVESIWIEILHFNQVLKNRWLHVYRTFVKTHVGDFFLAHLFREIKID